MTNRQSLTAKKRLLPMLSLMILGLSSLACAGLFNREDADVSYDAKVPLPFPEFDSAALCPSGEDCSGEGVAAPEERMLEPLEVNIDIDIVEKSGIDELSQYAGKFKSINITKIEYTVVPNTLTVDLPPLTLYLAPLGTMSVDDDAAVPFATIPEIPAEQEVAKGDATIIAENAEDISNLIKGLKVAALAKATPVVKKGQLFPPKGKAKITATVYITFTANPIDASGL